MRRLLLAIVSIGDFCIGKNLYLANDIRIIGLVNHREAAFSKLITERVLFFVDADHLPFQLH